MVRVSELVKLVVSCDVYATISAVVLAAPEKPQFLRTQTLPTESVMLEGVLAALPAALSPE